MNKMSQRLFLTNLRELSHGDRLLVESERTQVGLATPIGQGRHYGLLYHLVIVTFPIYDIQRKHISRNKIDRLYLVKTARPKYYQEKVTCECELLDEEITNSEDLLGAIKHKISLDCDLDLKFITASRGVNPGVSLTEVMDVIRSNLV